MGKLDSGLIFALLMLNMVTSAPAVVSARGSLVTVHQQNGGSLAGLDVLQLSQGYFGKQNGYSLDVKDAAWNLRGYQTASGDKDVFSRRWSALESVSLQSHFVSVWARQYGEPMEWKNFACVDGDSMQLVIGVNDTGQNNYCELVDRLVENDGGLVNSVLIGNSSLAVVADVPLSNIDSFVSEAEGGGLASYVEPNMRYEIDTVPNDPDWSKQWGPRMIQADWAWNTTVGDHSVLVAVVDTGIDWHHPDLAANYVALGYDWVNNDSDPMDDNGHGTHVAGVIAAAINNSIGIAGLAQVRIMAEKALDASGSGTSGELASAIVDAVNKGADIISCSWGSYVQSTVLHEAVRYAYAHGVLVVAAAGNDATSLKHYPAAFPEVVAVAATDEFDNPAYFTNYGDWVKVAAPGVDIYSTFLDDAYVYMSGTSMATPHVSGVAALIWSRFPNMTRDQVLAQLDGTSDDLGTPGFDIHYGYGRVNARKAVEQAPSEHDVLVLNLNVPPHLRPGDTTVVNATILDMGTSNESSITAQLLVNGAVIDSETIDFLVSGGSASVSYLWKPVTQGVYNVTCYVLPLAGEAVVSNNFLSVQVAVTVPQIIRVPQDYARIQDAINAAFEGDTILVASGTYCENVWMNKDGLALVGEDQGSTIVDGQGNGDVILVTANCVEISGFTLRNSLYSLGYAGIFVASEGVAISNTTTVNNYHGILLYDAVNATLRNNNMTGNRYNFGVDGQSVPDFVQDVDASNTVNGRPVYYLVNQNGRSVPSDAGYVAIVNSSNITVRDLQLQSNYEGALLAATVNSFVENVNASGNYFGVRLTLSCNDTVQSNTASTNYVGICVDESENNSVKSNTLMFNVEGLDLYCSEEISVGLNKLLNNDFGFYVEESSYSVLRNNSMSANRHNFGVLGSCLSHFIQDVDTSNTVEGRPVYYWLNQKDREVPPDAGYVGVVNCSNISIRGLSLANNVQGVLLAYASECLIESVKASDNAYGVYLYGSSGNTVIRNTVTSMSERGIELIGSSDNVVGDNTVTNNEIDIGLWLSSENNTISGNAASHAAIGAGLYLDSSAGNNIYNNTAATSNQGILLYDSGGNTLRSNNISGNSYNFGVYGSSVSDYVNDVDGSNVVNGKQIYYGVNQHGKRVPADVGYVAVVNSSGVSVADLTLSNNEQGVLFAYATGSTITDVSASDDYNSVYLWYSNGNVISGSSIADSAWDGVGLYYSEDNRIAGNTVTNASIGVDVTLSPDNTVDTNTVLKSIVGVLAYHSASNTVVSNKVSGGARSLAGIALSGASWNTIRRNKVSNNTFMIGAGVYLEWLSNDNVIIQNTLSDNHYGVSIGYWGLYGQRDQSDNNTIYHNNFIKNAEQALSLNSVNTWDNGYPSGGNYWSDYTGVDLYSGPYQNETGSDGLGDIQYVIDGNNTDRYPFTQPYAPVLGDLNHDGTVDMLDAVQEASAFQCYPGHPSWNSDADLNQDGVIDILDVIMLAGNFGKTVGD